MKRAGRAPRLSVATLTATLAAALAGTLGLAPGGSIALQAQEGAASAVAPEVYEVEGVRVVHLNDPARAVVAARLYILGGARQLAPETAGAERLILMASERGTEGFPGPELLRAQVGTGGSFYSSTAPDWSIIGFTGLVDNFEASWEILAERVARPALEPTAVELVRAQALTSLRASGEVPDGQVRRLAEGLAFADHPYAVDVDGTEASLTTLDVEDLRAYHRGEFVRSRMLLSVVGAVDRSEVEAAIRSTLAELPLGSYEWELPPPWTREEPEVAAEARSLPTNYLVGYFGGPTSADENYRAFQIAVTILSSYISSEIRDRGLSYSAGIRFVERAGAGGAIHVTTVDPEASLRIVNDAITTFGGGSIPRYLLRNYAEDSALEYHLSNQTSDQQARFLATSWLLHGTLRSVDDWVQDIRDVSGFDVRTAVRNYLQNIQWGYLGALPALPEDAMDR